MTDPRATPPSLGGPGSVERRLEDGSRDQLVREEPLLIELAGGGEVLTMRTPGDDAHLAIGFLLGEGVIEDAAAVADVRLERGDPTALRPDRAHVVPRADARARIQGRLTRTHEVRPSCGVCGLTDADTLLDDLPPLLPGVPRIDLDRVAACATELGAHQELFAATGASHGAALFGPDATLWAVAEDVGRHNALDKAIGRAARDGRALDRAVVLLSGRAGYDLVLKCLRVRIPVILSVSAPSALAFDLCRTAGATLIGFVRGRRAKVYWGAQRVSGQP